MSGIKLNIPKSAFLLHDATSVVVVVTGAWRVMSLTTT